jgi:hypothetical protein
VAFRRRLDEEAADVLARHGLAQRDVAAAVRARADALGEPADPWYLSVLPSQEVSGPRAAIAQHVESPASVRRDYEVTVGFWSESESYQLGTLTIAACSRAEARQRGIDLMVAPGLIEDGCEPWALVEPCSARSQPRSRSERRTYDVTVGVVSRVGTSRPIGWLQIRAGSPREARERGIRALIDPHHRGAEHAPWARAVRCDIEIEAPRPPDEDVDS